MQLPRSVHFRRAVSIACVLLAAPVHGSASGPDRFPRSGWRASIKAVDQARLDGLTEAWEVARTQVRNAGYGARLDALGGLALPGAGGMGALPPAGWYRCRVIKLGSALAAAGAEQGLAYSEGAFFRCLVGERLVAPVPGTMERRRTLTKTTGSQRMSGRLFDDGDRRGIFIGTLALGNERGWPAYSDLDERDLAGVVDRVGSQRWRVVIPWPRYESVLDLVELVPA